MAIPTEYTEATLKAFMHSELREVAEVLGWTVNAGSYDPIVDNTLELYGVSTITEAIDIKKLRLLARVALWRAVVTTVSLDYAFSADGGNFSRNQMVESARRTLQSLETDALSYLDSYIVQVAALHSPKDPYRVQDEDVL